MFVHMLRNRALHVVGCMSQKTHDSLLSQPSEEYKHAGARVGHDIPLHVSLEYETVVSREYHWQLFMQSQIHKVKSFTDIHQHFIRIHFILNIFL